MGHCDFPSHAHQTDAVQQVVEDGYAKLTQFIASFRSSNCISVLGTRTSSWPTNQRHNNLIVAPIHRLSDEVLLLVLELSANGPYMMPADPKLPPWLESAVCQRWRNVLLSFPTLWSGITFTPGEDVDYGQDTAMLPLHCFRAQLQLF